jgi:hypothetical protein
MTRKAIEKLPHGTRMEWEPDGTIGTLIHDISYSWIEWPDGQRTYSHDDPALKYVRVATERHPSPASPE